MVAELAQVDSLPCAEVEAATGDGYGDARAYERSFGVGGHVVGAFEGVEVIWLALSDEAVENAFEVGAHVGVGVLIIVRAAEVCCMKRWSSPA